MWGMGRAGGSILQAEQGNQPCQHHSDYAGVPRKLGQYRDYGEGDY